MAFFSPPRMPGVKCLELVFIVVVVAVVAAVVVVVVEGRGAVVTVISKVE